MANTRHYRIADRLYLVHQQTTAQAVPKAAPSPTNHIVVLDCSGSMSGELPEIRTQLKKKLPKLLAEQDTLSIVWFSGKGQYGTLVENEPVSTLADLQTVEKAIDRWLKPVGLTGFREPIEEVERLIERIQKSRPDSVFSLFFMSDGQDNQWSRTDILGAVEKAAGKLASSTFVEYGYYADRPTLTSMAEKAGGTLIHAKDFDAYEPAFEAAMSKRIMGGKKIELEVQGDAVGGFVFAALPPDLMTFEVGPGKVWVPEGLSGIWYVSASPVGERQTDMSVFCSGKVDNEAVQAAYAALSLYAVRMRPDTVLGLLKALGDVSFIEQYGGLFGKQAYSAFMDTAKAAAFDVSQRYLKGYDANRIPPENAYTVVEFLRDLSSQEDNRLLLDHSAFQYQRIGRARVDASQLLGEDEQAEVTRLTAEMAQTKDARKIVELATKIASISDKGEALKFTADPAPNGYAVSNLTYNEERPNISILVKKSGTVDLSSRSPQHGIPSTFQTFVFRNYAIVKDGIVNVRVLPCLLSDETRAKMADAVRDGRASTDFFAFEQDGDRQVVLVNLDKLPVLNRQMVRSISAKDFFERQYELTKAQAEVKVYNAIRKEQFPYAPEGFSELYGEEGAAWLKEQGFTPYSGFSPKTVQAESTDFYVGKELKVSLKGLSTLPTVKVARENIAKGKVNPPTALMRRALEAVDGFLKINETYKGSADPKEVFETWLDSSIKSSTARVRRMQREIAEDVLTLVVGQVWFSEFQSLEEGSMTITVDDQPLECRAELRSIEVKI